MSFTDEVRTNRKLKQPTQRGFDTAAWKLAFEAAEEPSRRDRDLYEAGLRLNDQLSAARTAIDAQFPYTLKTRDRVRAMVAVVNHQMLVMREQQEQAALNESLGHPLVDPVFAPTIGEVSTYTELVQRYASGLENLVEALRYPLSRASASAPPGTERHEATPHDVLNALNLASFYNVLEHAWNDCLWRDWSVQDHEAVDVLVQEKSLREEIITTGYFRYGMLLREYGAYRRHIRATQPRFRSRWDAVAPAHLHLPETINGIPDGRADQNDADQAADFGFSYDVFLSSEPYWDTLLSTALPKLPKVVTLGDALRARSWVTALAAEARHRMPKGDGVEDMAALMAYAPTYRFTDLRDALARSLDLRPVAAASLLNLFIATRDHKEDLWTRPFISAGAGTYVLLMPAAFDHNLARDTLAWMGLGGLDPEVRGPAFEAFARLELTQMIEIPDTSVFPRDCVFAAAEQSEQIDLVVRIGTKIVIAECRCLGVPVSGYDHYLLFEKTLRDKAGQARRKAKFAEANAAAFLHHIGVGHVDPSEAEFLPCVVTNVPIPSGYPADGVPVVDLQILAAFLGGGRIPAATRQNPDGTLERLAEIAVYATAADAPAALTDYLFNPPQIERYRESIGWQHTPPLQVGADVRPFITLHLSVGYPVIAFEPKPADGD
jgi:hypothetical protein